MIVVWSPCRAVPGREVRYSQPAPDVLAINGDELDMSDTGYVEYDIPEQFRSYVQRAWREGGELHVRLVTHHGARNQLRDEVTRQYDVGDLTW